MTVARFYFRRLHLRPWKVALLVGLVMFGALIAAVMGAGQ